MIRRSIVVFDEFLTGLSAGGAHVITSSGFLEPLGSFDQLNIEVKLNHVNQTDTFDLFLTHAADGHNFIAVKAGVPSPPTTAGTGDIAFPSLSTTADNVRTYSHNAAGRPLLAFVRLTMFFGFSSTKGQVKIIAHQRDKEKHDIKPLPMPRLGKNPPPPPVKTFGEELWEGKDPFLGLDFGRGADHGNHKDK